MSRRRFLIVFALAMLMTAPLVAQVKVRSTRIERAGFAIDLPHYFIVDDSAEAAALDSWSPPAADRRGLSWDMSIRVHAANGANPRRAPIDEGMASVAQSIRDRYGRDLLGGPVVVSVEIRGGDSARLMIYRVKEQGLQWWRYDLYVHTGQDVYLASAFLNGRAGSEVLEKDYPAGDLLRKSLLTAQIVPPPATQATTAPATQPASP